MRQLRLGELINILKIYPEEMAVYYDFCNFMPTLDFNSYRGIYEDLSIGYMKDVYCKKSLTVKCLKEGLEKVIGMEFTGYKGGDFIMKNHTKIWVANYGESDNTAIAGVSCYGDCEIILETQKLGW